MNFKQLEYEPIDERILVQPGPVKKVICEMQVPDDEKNIDKTIDDIREVKTVKEKVRTAFRVGQILKGRGTKLVNNYQPGTSALCPEEIEVFKEGDWVVYAEKSAVKFDLLTNKDPDDKCPVLLKRYDIVAKVKNIE
jgi:hypothetical protein